MTKNVMPVQVKILRVNPLAKLPAYATAGASGMDVRAMQSATLMPGRAMKIPLGIALSLPAGYEAQIRPRSGLTAKGVHCGWGTGDEDYRGELSAVLTFHSWSHNDRYDVEIGDRIGQLVIVPVPRIQWDEVSTQEELGTTTRGTKGFGSSGVK